MQTEQTMKSDPLLISRFGQSYRLNPNLVEQKKLSPAQVAELVEEHRYKLLVFELAKNTENPSLIVELSDELTQIEYRMQRLWGFPIDSNYHEWYLFPKCKCPKMDNADNRGSSRRIISADCLVHG